MKKLIAILCVFIVSSLLFSAFAQEDDVVFFSTPPAEGVAFNNVGIGGALMNFTGTDNIERKFYGLNLNYYHKHSWWTVLASATAGKGASENPEGSKTAVMAGAYAGVDLVRSPKLAFELYPVGVLAGKYGGSDSSMVSLAGAGRFCIYFKYNMAIIFGGEFAYSFKKENKNSFGAVSGGIMISL